jgi:hypothetical protein
MPRLAAAFALVVLAAAVPGCGGESEGTRTTSTSTSTSSAQAVSLPEIVYIRAGGRTPPADRERLDVVKDGTFTLQRAVRSSAVGRFAGALTAEEAASLGAAARAAAAAGALTATRVPDAAGETVMVDGIGASLGGGTPAGPWGPLVERLRVLTGVPLEVAPGATKASLVRVGRGPLGVDLTDLRVTVVAFAGDGSQAGRWESPPSAADGVETTEPGWTKPLPFDHGLVLAPGQSLQVSARFALTDDPAAGAVLATTTV